MRLVQVLGTNGAGKSALLKALAARDVDAWHENGYTVLPVLRFVLIGNYVDPGIYTPGADGIHSKAELLGHLDGASRWAKGQPQLWAVAWEGIIIMTRQYHPEYLARGLEPLYVVVDTPVDLCFARIEQRSGKTRDQLKGNGRIVVGRAQGVARLAAWLTTQGAEVLWLDGQASPDDNAGRLLRATWRVRPTGGTRQFTTRDITTPATSSTVST